MTAAICSGALAGLCVLLSAHTRGLPSVTRARGRMGGGVMGAPALTAYPRSGLSVISSMSPMPMPVRLRRAVLATGVRWAPERVVACWVAAGAAAVLLGTSAGGFPTGLIALVAVLAGGVAALWFTRHRRRDLADRALPALLESVARSLRSGVSLTQALLEAPAAVEGTPLADDVVLLTRAVERGSPLTLALERWGESGDSRPLHMAAAAMTLAAETGGAPGPLVDAVAQTLRDRDGLEREARALSTQARGSAVVVAVAPLVFTAIAAMADPHVAVFLFRTPLGLACLVAGLMLEGAGAWWMAHLVAGRS